MTVARRILLNVAFGAAIVIAVVAAVTYRLVYQAAEQRTIESLNTYVAERTRREEAGFRTIYSNLEVVRGLFLKRDKEPILPDVQERWDQRFMLYPDGAWRSREEFYSPRVFSNLWLHKDFKLTPQFQTRVLRAQEICEDVQPGWIDSFVSVYFILPGPATMGFDPRIPRWSWQTPGDYDLEAEEWVKEASPARNPSRGFVWTGVFVDPPTNEPFVTVQLPVEKDGEQLATVAHDMHINQLFNEITRSEFEGATHLIFRPDGRLIVHPALREKILASNGQLKAEEVGDPGLASLFRLCVAHDERQFAGFEPVTKSYFSASRLPAAEWFFVTLMSRGEVQRQAFRSAQWVWLSGLASLGLLLASFAGILRRQVTRPLAKLTQATEAMSAGQRDVPVEVHRDDEFGKLAASFREMVGKVVAREADLRQLNLDLEKRVVARTEDLNQALAREREVGEMKSRFTSLVSHEFRTPLGVIGSSAQILDRYLARLDDEERAEHLANIRDSVKRMAAMMEEMLVLSRVDSGRMEFKPECIALGDFCRRLLDELHSAHGCSTAFEVMPDAEVPALADETLLRHILTNLLTNAHKYSPPGAPVHLTLARANGDAVFTVRDEGIGIPEADQARLFEAFHRASNVCHISGTGLGLVLVRRCCELHGGGVKVTSREGAGTTFTVRLPVFAEE